MAKTKINKVMIIGTLTEVDTTIRTTADGRNWISGKAIVKVNQDGVESLVEARVLAFEKTKDGGINKLYTSYAGLEGNLNKRVKITGDLREDSFVKPDGTLQKYNSIYLKFINLAKNDEVDCATFEYSGFVTKEIYERRSKDDELLGYRIEVAQANYNDKNMQVLRFDVDKDDVNIYQAVSGYYTVGETISFNGTITHVTRTETRTEEQAFGDPLVKSIVISDKTYRIKGGNNPFAADDPTAYTEAEISALVEAYKAADADKIAKAKTQEAPAATNSVGAAMNNLTKPATAAKRSSLL